MLLRTNTERHMTSPVPKNERSHSSRCDEERALNDHLLHPSLRTNARIARAPTYEDAFVVQNGTLPLYWVPYKGPHCSLDLPKASEMCICAGPVGRQSGNVEKVLVFITLFEGSKKQRVPPMTSELRTCESLVGPKNGNVEKVLVFL